MYNNNSNFYGFLSLLVRLRIAPTSYVAHAPPAQRFWSSATRASHASRSATMAVALNPGAHRRRDGLGRARRAAGISGRRDAGRVGARDYPAGGRDSTGVASVAMGSERIRVLLADDHRLFREALRTVLERECDVVGEAASGEEAVALAARTRPDIVLLDVGMPGVGGLNAAHRLAQGVAELQGGDPEPARR